MASACLLALPAAADTSVLGLPLEDLLQLEVFSASRTAATVLETPASVTVLTADQIACIGAQDIAEALELAAGVESLHVTQRRRAIGIRGQNGLLSNKLLVMQDGRSLYSPLFSGTWWEMLDVPLEDLDRVEIIRGPGATVWGANAVNGIINILTRPADQTQGSLLHATAGSLDNASVYLRHGGALAPNTHYRAYARAAAHGGGGTLEIVRPDGTIPEAHDAFRDVRGGIRIDHADNGTEWMVDVGAFHIDFEETIFGPGYTPPAFVDTLRVEATADGAYANLRFARDTGNARHALYAWVDASLYDHPAYFEADRLTANLDWQIEQPLGDRHALSAGLGARLTADAVEETPLFLVINEHALKHQFSAFVQDTITLQPARWQLLLGAKLEYGYFHDFELQPQARVLYTPNPGTTWWAAASRAARTPTRSERDGHVVVAPRAAAGMPTAYIIVPNPAFDSEILTAVESGLRFRTGETAVVSASAFLNTYEGLRTPRSAPLNLARVHNGILYLPIQLSNGGTMQTWGFEAEADWAPAPWWGARATFSLVAEPDTDMNLGTVADRIRTYLNLHLHAKPAEGWETGLWLRHNNSRRVSFPPEPDIRPWWNLDARVAWTPQPGLTFALTGHNLLEPERLEATSEAQRILPTTVRRSVDLSVSWEF